MRNWNGRRCVREKGLEEVEYGWNDLGWKYFTKTQRPMNARWLMGVVEVYVFNSCELFRSMPKAGGTRCGVR